MDKSIMITELEGFFSEIRWIASAMNVFFIWCGNIVFKRKFGVKGRMGKCFDKVVCSVYNFIQVFAVSPIELGVTQKGSWVGGMVQLTLIFMT